MRIPLIDGKRLKKDFFVFHFSVTRVLIYENIVTSWLQVQHVVVWRTRRPLYFQFTSVPSSRRVPTTEYRPPYSVLGSFRTFDLNVGTFNSLWSKFFARFVYARVVQVC